VSGALQDGLDLFPEAGQLGPVRNNGRQDTITDERVHRQVPPLLARLFVDKGARTFALCSGLLAPRRDCVIGVQGGALSPGSARRRVGGQHVGEALLAQLAEAHSERYWQQTLDAWNEELYADPNHQQVIGDAVAVIERFGDKDLPEEMGAFGSHPGLLRMLARVQRQLNNRRY